MRRETVIGLAGSALWLAILGALVYLKREGLADLTLADWGNFLGGASSGIALLWLVLGYYQNAKAVELQGQELKHQVEETRGLVRESQAQAQAARGMLELDREKFELEKQNHQRAVAREHDQAKPRFVHASGSRGRSKLSARCSLGIASGRAGGQAADYRPRRRSATDQRSSRFR